MATRKRRPWNHDLRIPGLLDDPPSPPPAPLPGNIITGPSTPGTPPSEWECLRCEQLRHGLQPVVPDHSPRCSYRGTGRDPNPSG